MAFSRKVYVYKRLFDFFGDETIIIDFLKAFYLVFLTLDKESETNKDLLDILHKFVIDVRKVETLINSFDKNLFDKNEEKISIRIYDEDDIILSNENLLCKFGLTNYKNNLTKMPKFSLFVNVFLFLLIKKMNMIFGVNNYDEFEEKWREYIMKIDGLDDEIKCMYLSNNFYENFIPRLYHLFF
jgi:hypothetical protein